MYLMIGTTVICIKMILLEFLETHSLISNVMLHTEYSFPDFKCYGHLAKLQQDWVEIMIHNKIH